ncbi:MAG: glycerol-3-phosphate 1-O-acyltransferase PlsY [Hyphomicrobiales bacterium]|nr:glycerol-3-phosphate 1-O-acyltransferase PlsY [Hyphomicrobiales bacterium]
MTELTAILAALSIGYLCGSVPFGLLLTRWAGTPDIRTIGSGNIGSTNVLRTGRKDLAAATLLLDALKGTLAVVVCRNILGADAALAAAVGAFLGHVYPLWLQFRGGKGVATYLGALLGVAWVAGLAFALIWLAVAFTTRYSSAAALLASLLTPLVLVGLHQYPVALVFLVLTLALWFTHRANLSRLRQGSESRIGAK